jgi:hypothetical protein
MADSFLGLADLAIVNDMNAADLGVTDIFEDAPFLNALAADTTDGDTHKYIKQTGAPTVGFRAVNVGIDRSKSTDVAVTVTLKLLDASVTVDKGLADQYHRGTDAYMARETRRHLRTAIKLAEQQFIQGTTGGGAAAGFAGFMDNQAAINTAGMWHNAGGTTALTSVWMLRTSDDGRDVQAIWGNDGRIDIDPYASQEVQDGSGSRYHAYVSAIMSWIGIQIGSAKSVGRIANIDAGSNSLDDDMLSSGLELFPEELQPNLIVMNKRSRFQLQRSRTATTTTGAEAPLPTSFMGIPIITTSSVPLAESAVS